MKIICLNEMMGFYYNKLKFNQIIKSIGNSLDLIVSNSSSQSHFVEKIWYIIGAITLY